MAVGDSPGAAADPVPVADLGAVHFVGIGGVGMSALARILRGRGVSVSGSDARDSAVTSGLRDLGARVEIGHRAENVAGADTVVVSSAIRADNPELLAAGARGLRLLHRSELLASIMLGRRAVAVAGTHGKTTTTSMLAVALDHCGAEASFAIGGELTGAPSERASAHEGSGDVFVAEADESDSSFLRYRPTVAVVTNVEPDHLDHYGSAEAVEAAFVAFTERIVPGGLLVVCADDDGAARVTRHVRRDRPGDVEVITYGERPGCDVRITRLGTAGGGVEATLQCRPGLPDRVAALASAGPLRLRVPGRHNAGNAVAAAVAGTWLGYPAGCLVEGLSGFVGARRRFELRGTAGGIEVRDDYAHHPTEVAAALRAARSVATGRVVVVFQPHLYSRTRIFAGAFGRALALADEVIVLDVYAAREDPEPGVTGELVSRAVPLPAGAVHYAPTADDAHALLLRSTRAGDLVITMGAGDVTALGPRFVTSLAAQGAQVS